MPNSPNQARVEVVGEHSVHIWWLQPEADSGGICTKFKGELDKHDKHGSASAFLLNVEYSFSLTGSLSLSTIFTVMLFFFSCFLFAVSKSSMVNSSGFCLPWWRAGGARYTDLEARRSRR